MLFVESLFFFYLWGNGKSWLRTLPLMVSLVCLQSRGSEATVVSITLYAAANPIDPPNPRGSAALATNRWYVLMANRMEKNTLTTHRFNLKSIVETLKKLVSPSVASYVRTIRYVRSFVRSFLLSLCFFRTFSTFFVYIA